MACTSTSSAGRSTRSSCGTAGRRVSVSRGTRSRTAGPRSTASGDGSTKRAARHEHSRHQRRGLHHHAVRERPGAHTSNWYNPNGSPLAINGPWTVRRIPTLTAITPLDEDLKTQFQDQFIVGGEYQFRRHGASASASWPASLRRIIEDIGTFTNPDDPLELTGYVIGNPGEGFFGGPFDKPKRTYRARRGHAAARVPNSWHLYSSFVYARGRGNHEGLYMSGYDQLDPNINALYDIPSFLPIRRQAALGQALSVQASSPPTRFDWGLTLSEGRCLGWRADQAAGSGNRERLRRRHDFPAGARLAGPDAHVLELGLPRRLPAAARRPRAESHVSVVLDVFNLFNRHGTWKSIQDYVYEGHGQFQPVGGRSNLDAFGNPKFNPNCRRARSTSTPILFQSPRTVQVGFKFTF